MSRNPPVLIQREATLYPPDALEGREHEAIDPREMPTLAAVFRERVRRTPYAVAYREYDRRAETWCDYSWLDTAREVARWQAALDAEGLQPGDRVALRLRNGRDWVIFDQAALGLGLVVVPLYVDDRPENVAYILEQTGARLLLLAEQAQWGTMGGERAALEGLRRAVVLGPLSDSDADARLVSARDWLPAHGGELRHREALPEGLATIVYTSGTTGRPKGVMLSHANLVSNVYAGLRSVPVGASDVLLSFLPLSHTLERTVGYYMPIMIGATVAYARSTADLPEDLLAVRPTVMICVPRIFERVCARMKDQLAKAPASKRRLFERAVDIGWRRFLWRQGRGRWQADFAWWPLLDALVARKVRARLGGRLQVAICGGAPLSPAVSRVFIGLGLRLLQGYGLTESSPVISVNTLDYDVPASIGLPLHGVRVRIGENDELLAKGPNVMLGYWNNPQASRQAVDDDGWLHSGDRARIENGFIHIIGRLKEIIVLANGEKVPPADMEAAIAEDPLFEQSMVIGEGRPYLCAIVVLHSEHWDALAAELGVRAGDEAALHGEALERRLLERIAARLHGFPGYAQVRRVTASLEAWTPENGFTTPTLKIKRPRLGEHFRGDIDRMYEGH